MSKRRYSSRSQRLAGNENQRLCLDSEGAREPEAPVGIPSQSLGTR